MTEVASVPDRLVVGCMTGTSIDALDVALVRIRGRGLWMHAEFLHGLSRDLATPSRLGARLRDLADQRPASSGDIAGLSREFALFHADAIREVLAHRSERPALVCVHGQTIFHTPPVSWQMFNGPVLAAALRLPVLFDLRAADLAAGGQGAPITPLADWIFFRGPDPLAIVNLGGFSNATLLPAQADPDGIHAIRGFDICACNHLLDRVARECLNAPYDAGGAAALSGRPHAESRDALLAILTSQARAGRSLGTGDETGAWIAHWKPRVSAPDLAASACDAIGAAITRRLASTPSILVAGGGAHNAALLTAMRRHSGARVESTSTRALPIEFREAAEMAILGALCQDRVPITLPGVTGVSDPAPLAGLWAGL